MHAFMVQVYGLWGMCSQRSEEMLHEFHMKDGDVTVGSLCFLSTCFMLKHSLSVTLSPELFTSEPNNSRTDR